MLEEISREHIFGLLKHESNNCFMRPEHPLHSVTHEI